MHIVRYGGLKRQSLTGLRMNKRQLVGMKHLTGDREFFTNTGHLLVKNVMTVASAIYRIPENRMLNGGEMNTDLMGSAGFQVYLNKVGIVETFLHLP